ncbi:MAG: hypothetical protein OHK006_12760 [Thermodesulfovibrionales bacterium]
MQNFLVPFNFQTFSTTEAVWDFSKKETIKMFRMTRRGIGEFVTPESSRPQRVIDKIIERNPHLRNISVAVTVTATDGKNYEVETYDVWGIYQICVESALPRAKEFLRRFPALMEALFTHRIMPPAIGNVRPELLAYNGIPYNQKAAYRRSVCDLLGWTEQKLYRQIEKAEKLLGVQIVYKKRMRSTAGSTKYPELKAQVIKYWEEHPGAGGKEIRTSLRLALPSETINRWIRAA